MKKDESAHFGQKIRTESGPDRSSHKVDMNEAVMGRNMTDRGTAASTDPKMYNDKGGNPGR